MLTIPFPNRIPPDAPLVYIGDRPRHASLTSVKWLDDRTLACGDFLGCTLYLVELDGATGQIVSEQPTRDAEGNPTHTDLMDFDGRDRVAVSNFERGTVSLYRWTPGVLTFLSESPRRRSMTQIHGVRILDARRVAITYNLQRLSCWQILNAALTRVRATVSCKAQPQDIVKVGPYLVVSARTDHISRNGHAAGPIRASLYLYRDGKKPTLVQAWEGDGHLDALAVEDGVIYAANQYCDRVDRFVIEGETLRLAGSIPGMAFPHGLDVRCGRLAVTNYGSNALHILDLSAQEQAA